MKCATTLARATLLSLGLLIPINLWAQVPYTDNLEWDPAGVALSGSWSHPDHFFVDENFGYLNSPWVRRFYDETGIPHVDESQPRPFGQYPLNPWWRSPQVYYYEPVVFFRSGSYNVTMNGAEAWQVYVTSGNVTFDATGANGWSVLEVGTDAGTATATLGGTGEYLMSSAKVFTDSLLTLGGSASVSLYGSLSDRLEVASGAALHVTGESSLTFWDVGSPWHGYLSLAGTTVVDQSALIERVAVWEGGLLTLQDSATVSSFLYVSGEAFIRGSAQQEGKLDTYGPGSLLVVEENARLVATDTSVESGGRLELDSVADIQTLGNLVIRGDDSVLELKRGIAIATPTEYGPAIVLSHNGRLIVHTDSVLATNGDVAIGVPYTSIWSPASSGTLDLRGGMVMSEDAEGVMNVRGEVVGHGSIVGFQEINFLGGGVYLPGGGDDQNLIICGNVRVGGDATDLFSPVSAMYAPESMAVTGQVEIAAGGLVEVDSTNVFSAGHLVVGGQSFKSGILRSSGSVIAAGDTEGTSGTILIEQYGEVNARGLLGGQVQLAGGRLTATGDLLMGDGQSAEGFRMTAGSLVVGTSKVSLMDYDGAEISGGSISLTGGSLSSVFTDSVGGAPVIRMSGNASIEGYGTIEARLLAGGSSYVRVPLNRRLTLDTSAEIFEGGSPSHIHYLDIAGEFVHNAGWGASIVTVDTMRLDNGSYRVENGSSGSHIALQPGGGIIGQGFIGTEVRGVGVGIHPTGYLYVESATLTDSYLGIDDETLIFRYSLSLQRSTVQIEGGIVRTTPDLSTGGGSTIELTQSTIMGRGTMNAEQPIESRGSKFISQGGTLILDSDLTGNGVLVGDVHVTGSITGTDTGYSIPGLLVLDGNAVVFGNGRTTFDTGVNFGNGTRLSAVGGFLIGSEAVVTGSGIFAGDLTNDGTIAPGNSPGVVTVEGNMSLSSMSLIEMELGGSTAGIDYDQIVVTGNMLFDGELQLSILGLVEIGNTFELFSIGGSLSGNFSSILFANGLYDGIFDYNSGTLTVTAVPEPGTSALLALGLLPFLRRRRTAQG